MGENKKMIIFTFFHFPPLTSEGYIFFERGKTVKMRSQKRIFLCSKATFHSLNPRLASISLKNGSPRARYSACYGAIMLICKEIGQTAESGYMVDVTSPVRAGA